MAYQDNDYSPAAVQSRIDALPPQPAVQPTPNVMNPPAAVAPPPAPTGTAGFPAPVDNPEAGPVTTLSWKGFGGADASAPPGANPPVFQSPWQATTTGAPPAAPAAPPAAPSIGVGVSGAPRTGPGGTPGGVAGMFGVQPGLATDLMGAGGPVQTAAAAAPAPAAPTESGVAIPAPLTGNEYDPQKELAGIKGEYGAMKAQERADNEQAFNRRDASIKSEIQRGKDYQHQQALRNAGVDVRVAAMHGKQAAFGPDWNAADRGAVQAATNPNAAPSRDYFKEAATAQDMGLKGRKSATDERTAALGVKGQQLDVAAKQRVDALGAKIASGKATPEDHKALLSLLGKDKPDEYTVSHVAGGSITNADGTTTKYPDRLFAVHKGSGKAEELTMGAGAAPGGGKQPPADPAGWLKANTAAHPEMSQADLKKQYKASFGVDYK